MPFKSSISAGVGTTATTVTPTINAGQTATLIGLSMANVLSTTVTVSARLVKSGGTAAHLVKDATVLPGGALAIVGGDQKVVLEAGDSVTVSSNTAASIDVVISYLI